MADTPPSIPKNVLALFSNEEKKKLFANYLVFMGLVEAGILAVSMAVKIGGGGQTPFPWRAYLFAAFAVPVAVTFLLVVFVMAFNKCLQESAEKDDPDLFTTVVNRDKKDLLDKFQLFLYVSRKTPFLLGLFVLGVSAGIIYRIDDIVAFVSRAGEKTALYFLGAVGTVLAVLAVLFVIWLVLNYRLKRRNMDHQHAYRAHVTEKTGFIVLDDNTVIDRSGRVVAAGGPVARLEDGTGSRGPLPLLPRFGRPGGGEPPAPGGDDEPPEDGRPPVTD